MVAIMSPPYFHPEQAAAAVEAGVHVYVAKPIAVDVPGCRSIEASAKLAGEKKLCFLVDFQTRSTAFYQEAIKRVHAGAIGELTFGEVFYHCGRLGKQAATDEVTAASATGSLTRRSRGHHHRTEYPLH